MSRRSTTFGCRSAPRPPEGGELFRARREAGQIEGDAGEPGRVRVRYGRVLASHLLEQETIDRGAPIRPRPGGDSGRDTGWKTRPASCSRSISPARAAARGVLDDDVRGAVRPRIRRPRRSSRTSSGPEPRREPARARGRRILVADGPMRREPCRLRRKSTPTSPLTAGPPTRSRPGTRGVRSGGVATRRSTGRTPSRSPESPGPNSPVRSLEARGLLAAAHASLQVRQGDLPVAVRVEPPEVPPVPRPPRRRSAVEVLVGAASAARRPPGRGRACSAALAGATAIAPGAPRRAGPNTRGFGDAGQREAVSMRLSARADLIIGRSRPFPLEPAVGSAFGFRGPLGRNGARAGSPSTLLEALEGPRCFWTRSGRRGATEVGQPISSSAEIAVGALPVRDDPFRRPRGRPERARRALAPAHPQADLRVRPIR